MGHWRAQRNWSGCRRHLQVVQFSLQLERSQGPLELLRPHLPWRDSFQTAPGSWDVFSERQPVTKQGGSSSNPSRCKKPQQAPWRQVSWPWSLSPPNLRSDSRLPYVLAPPSSKTVFPTGVPMVSVAWLQTLMPKLQPNPSTINAIFLNIGFLRWFFSNPAKPMFN